jgi:hypothetical protein
VFQKYSIPKPEDREHSGASPSATFLNEAKYMTGLLLQDASKKVDRVEILSQQKMMADALEILWSKVEEGKVRVQSIAVLRAAKNVSCPEIASRLKSSNIDHARVVRDLRLLINTFEYIIKPESS